MSYMLKWLFLAGLLFLVTGGEVFAASDGKDVQEDVCPTNLTKLEPQIEQVLGSILNNSFKKTIRDSLHASIPDAIQRADGITAQIKFLHRQIRAQYRSQEYAENVARKAGKNMNEKLVPCGAEEKGSYCDAVEQYYISEASNIANHGFLDALECYKRIGYR